MKNMFRILVCASVLAAMPALAEDTLFADLGGQPGIDRIADKSVDKYLADPRVGAIFDESNIERIRAQLKDHFCMVAGGPCKYTGHSMREAHRGLHLKNADFNALVEDLQLAMDDVGVPFSVQNRLLARLAPMQREVVTR
jgi:hemoglobin